MIDARQARELTQNRANSLLQDELNNIEELIRKEGLSPRPKTSIQIKDLSAAAMQTLMKKGFKVRPIQVQAGMQWDPYSETHHIISWAE